MARLDEIECTFGKPFVDVVRDHAAQGYSKKAAAKHIGLAHRYFRDLCKQFGLDQYFPTTMADMRKECRGGGRGWPSGKPRGKTHNKLDELVLLAEVNKYPSFSQFRSKAKFDINTVLRRFGSFENAVKAAVGSKVENTPSESTSISQQAICDRNNCGSLMRRETIAIRDECYICPTCGAYKPIPRARDKQIQTLLDDIQRRKEAPLVHKAEAVEKQTGESMPEIKDKIALETEKADLAKSAVSRIKNPRGICKICKRQNVIIPGGGKCSRCYSRIKKGLDPLTGKPLVAEFADEDGSLNPEPTPNTLVVSAQASVLASQQQPITLEDVSLSFNSDRDRKLYSLIVSQAERNRRTIESEILSLLEESLVNSAALQWPAERKSARDLGPAPVNSSSTAATGSHVVPVVPHADQQGPQCEHPLYVYFKERASCFTGTKEKGWAWLQQTGLRLMKALMARGVTFRIYDGQSPILTPNAGIFRIQGGPRTTVSAIEARVPEIFTTEGIQIIAVEPEAGSLRISVARPERELLHTEAVLRDYLAENHALLSSDKVVVGICEEDGKPLILDPYEQPHTLIAGTTGSGKSVLMQNFILSIAATHSPAESQIFLIDPKFGIDYAPFEKLPHLADGIITNQDAALGLLSNAVKEMEKRYRLFRKTGAGVNNVQAYRKATDKPLPTWWIIHDEFADWMQIKEYRKEVSQLVKRLGVNARAAGIFLVFAGQRPDHTVFPNLLRDQLGNRLILKVQSAGTSNVALGEKGAEKLLGKGHMLAKIGAQDSVFAQVPYLDPKELPAIVSEICRYHHGTTTRKLKIAA